MSITDDDMDFINWDDMDFGDFELSLCGICGKIEMDKGYYKWNDEQDNEQEEFEYELIEDIVCDDCEKIWEWDDDCFGYRKKIESYRK